VTPANPVPPTVVAPLPVVPPAVLSAATAEVVGTVPLAQRVPLTNDEVRRLGPQLNKGSTHQLDDRKDVRRMIQAAVAACIAAAVPSYAWVHVLYIWTQNQTSSHGVVFGDWLRTKCASKGWPVDRLYLSVDTELFERVICSYSNPRSLREVNTALLFSSSTDLKRHLHPSEWLATILTVLYLSGWGENGLAAMEWLKSKLERSGHDLASQMLERVLEYGNDHPLHGLDLVIDHLNQTMQHAFATFRAPAAKDLYRPRGVARLAALAAGKKGPGKQPKGACAYCQKAGHFWKDCEAYQADQKSGKFRAGWVAK